MNFIAKRLLRAGLTIFVVVNLSFFLVRYLPGGPVDYIMGQLRAQGSLGKSDPGDPEVIMRTYVNMDLSAPLHEQWFDYMTAFFLRGDLGQSIKYNKPVTEMYAEALVWTVFLIGTATLLTFVFGVLLGALMATLEGSRFDSTATTFSIVSNSIPYYIVAILLVFVLGDTMGLFPSRGRVDPNAVAGFNWPFVSSVLHHAALPILSWVATGVGGWALSMRGNSVRILGEDFLRAAKVRGLSNRRVTVSYMGRNAILPLYTWLMISLGYAFGGSVILEQIFVYRGVGWYMYDAIVARDYPLMMGGFFLITAAVVVGVLVAELTYSFIDPRIGQGDHEAY